MKGGKKGPVLGSTKPQSGLSEQERIFIKAFLRSGSRQESAEIAGYKCPKSMKMRPLVAAAVAEAQAAVAKETKYDLQEAMRLLRQDMNQAREDKQLSALAKMHELMMKGHGLLVEKYDVRQSGLNIQIMGIGDERVEKLVNGALPALPVLPLANEDDDTDLFD